MLGRNKSHPAFKGKNFLADEILGRWAVNGVPVELSEVTFPDFSGGGGRIRSVGITYIDADGQMASGGLVGSFKELDEVLEALTGVKV